MKIPEPKKLDSGMWRVQLQVNGKRVSRTFPTKRLASLWAAEVKFGTGDHGEQARDMSVASACQSYIRNKTNILSPSTLASYRRMMSSVPDWFLALNVSKVDRKAMQNMVNELSSRCSPKYTKNAHSFLSSAIKEIKPEFVSNAVLPKKQAVEMKIPTADEIALLDGYFKGTDMELPFLLAVYLGLREGEICGLTRECVSGNKLHIKQSLVRTDTGEYTLKAPKTFSGTRVLDMPDRIAKLVKKIPKRQEFLVGMTNSALYNKFKRACTNLGLDYRFHDLRHLNASIMIAQGVPNKYIIDRMGHITTNMIDKVYGHIMDEKRKEVAENVAKSVDELLNNARKTHEKRTKNAHKMHTPK